MLKLRCKTNELPEIDGVDWYDDCIEFTTGEVYDAFQSDSNTICITGDEGILETYTIYPDEDGLNYEIWFEVVEGEIK